MSNVSMCANMSLGVADAVGTGFRQRMHKL